MNLQQAIDYCAAKTEATEEFPFDDDTLVSKLGAKMFALIKLTDPYRINLKCDPITAIELRRKYTAVSAGYHMNKEHWNTVDLDNSVADNLLQGWIDNSYQLILNSLSKKEKAGLFS